MSKYFTKILVAIDGSESSMAAADCAISVANNYESGLIALYVIESGTSILGPTPPPHLIEIKNQAQEYLDKIKHKSYSSCMRRMRSGRVSTRCSLQPSRAAPPKSSGPRSWAWTQVAEGAVEDEDPLGGGGEEVRHRRTKGYRAIHADLDEYPAAASRVRSAAGRRRFVTVAA